MIDGSFEADGASVLYGDTKAIDAIDLEIAVGEAVGFVGPSGAGKTTLLRLLATALEPTAGRVLIGGHDPRKLTTARRRQLRSRIGFVHQDLRLIPNVRVVRNVLAGRLGRMSLAASARRLFLPSRDDLRRVHGLLERVGIGDKLYQRTDRLSGGEQQRVAIARALYQEPAALFADEPISSLDPVRARDTMRLLLEVCREYRLTLLTSLHDLDVARELLPRLVGLRHGRIVFDRAADQLDDQDFAQLYNLGADLGADHGAAHRASRSPGDG